MIKDITKTAAVAQRLQITVPVLCSASNLIKPNIVFQKPNNLNHTECAVEPNQ